MCLHVGCQTAVRRVLPHELLLQLSTAPQCWEIVCPCLAGKGWVCAYPCVTVDGGRLDHLLLLASIRQCLGKCRSRAVHAVAPHPMRAPSNKHTVCASHSSVKTRSLQTELKGWLGAHKPCQINIQRSRQVRACLTVHNPRVQRRARSLLILLPPLQSTHKHISTTFTVVNCPSSRPISHANQSQPRERSILSPKRKVRDSGRCSARICIPASLSGLWDLAFLVEDDYDSDCLAGLPNSLQLVQLERQYVRPTVPPQLQQCSRIESLELDKCSITPAELGSMPALQHLFLNKCLLLPMAPAVQYDGQHLSSAAAVSSFLCSLQQLTQLKTLSLKQVHLNVQEGVPAGEWSALTASTQLTRMSLQERMRQPLPPAVAQHVFPAGRQLPHLQTLELSTTLLNAGQEEWWWTGLTCTASWAPVPPWSSWT